MTTLEMPHDLVPPYGRKKTSWYKWPLVLVQRSLDFFSLSILIAIVAAIPLLQFASLGYLLTGAARLADGQPWSSALPGLRLAGRIGIFGLISGILSLIVILMSDLAYSAQLLEPGSTTAVVWRSASLAVSLGFLVHLSWAAVRGGRWWHLLWPAPVRFLREAWRPNVWRSAADRLFGLVESMKLPQLWWLGARATLGTLLWLAIPVTLMLFGLRAQESKVAPLVGSIGAIAMVWLMFYLPLMQIEFARTNDMRKFLSVRSARRLFKFAPIAYSIALVALCLLAIPLYVFRIEPTPPDLSWLPSVIFVLLMLPAKLLLGWAIGRAHRRELRALPIHRWWVRSAARVVGLTGVLIYVGALYLAPVVAGQGAIVMYFQHAFLAPNPLFAA